MLSFAGRAEDIVCWLTGLSVEKLRELPVDDHRRVVDAVAEQIGRELGDSRPFSSASLAAEVLRRAGLMARGMGSRGGGPVS